jgi:hypothetical protein
MLKLLKILIRKLGFYRLAFPPGHYASPIPDTEEALQALQQTPNLLVKDINLQSSKQLLLLREFESYIKTIPFNENADHSRFRYYFNNTMFQRMDGTILYAMLNHLKPKKFYEVGSGFSSGLVLDMKEMFKLDLKLTFIEPYPDRLESILKETDRLTTIIYKNKIQEIDVSVFEELNENDILFLDTSHIVKTGNDVTYWLFNILPVLKPGVIIHIHDIFWPFEYSKEWIENQKCYNEIYFIRAFLMNNNDYEILFFNSYVQNEFKSTLIEIDPNLIDNSGASLYLRKK